MLAACGFHEGVEFDPNEITLDLMRSAGNTEGELDYEDSVVFAHRFFTKLTSFEEWKIPVRIRSRVQSTLPTTVWDSLQVPIEHLSGLDKHLAWAWCCNEKHPCVLVPHEGEHNLLVQAIEAGIVINRYNNTGKTTQPVWADDKTITVPSEPIFELDRGSVLLAFELAGIAAPKEYDDWREPDGVNIPTRATLRHARHMGEVRVHYTNGEMALVTSESGMKAELMHVKYMESSASEVLKALTQNSKPKKDKKESTREAKVTEEDIKALAAKWFVGKVVAE